MLDTVAGVFGMSGDEFVKVFAGICLALTGLIGAIAKGVALVKKARVPRTRLFAKVRRIEDILEITLSSNSDPAIKDLLTKMKKHQRADADAKDVENDIEVSPNEPHD